MAPRILEVISRILQDLKDDGAEIKVIRNWQ
jgi:hypothetical protein